MVVAVKGRVETKGEEVLVELAAVVGVKIVASTDEGEAEGETKYPPPLEILVLAGGGRSVPNTAKSEK